MLKLQNQNTTVLKALCALATLSAFITFRSEAKLEVAESFQVGQNYTRNSIYDFNINILPESYKKIAFSVGRLGRGSGILLNQNGQYYFFTAAHLVLDKISSFDLELKKSILNDPEKLCFTYPDEVDSPRREVHLRLLDIYLKCERMIYLNLNYDIAIVKLEKIDLDISIGINLDDSAEIDFNTRLAFFSSLTDGVPGQNGEVDINFSTDEDCRSYGSSDSLFSSFERSIIDESPLSTRYLPVACDMIPGDSGGPIINYQTGQLIGLVSSRPRLSLQSTHSLWDEISVLDKQVQTEYIKMYLPRSSPIFPILSEIKKAFLFDQKK